ncbi:MAG: COX15/CtaA family protein, partial [Marinomonas sp.]
MTTEQTSSARTNLRLAAIATWLYIVAAMVVLIVFLGGIPRLTESGLSITRWELEAGILPPLTEAAWAAEFDLYRQTAEFKFESGPAGMDLATFKFIYFWEWFHRILGRLIGIAYALPLAWFWIKNAIPAGYK